MLLLARRPGRQTPRPFGSGARCPGLGAGPDALSAERQGGQRGGRAGTRAHSRREVPRSAPSGGQAQRPDGSLCRRAIVESPPMGHRGEADRADFGTVGSTARGRARRGTSGGIAHTAQSGRTATRRRAIGSVVATSRASWVCARGRSARRLAAPQASLRASAGGTVAPVQGSRRRSPAAGCA